MADFADIDVMDLEEGDEVFNGVRYLVVEDVRLVGDCVRIEADGISWTLEAGRLVRVATY